MQHMETAVICSIKSLPNLMFLIESAKHGKRAVKVNQGRMYHCNPTAGEKFY